MNTPAPRKPQLTQPEAIAYRDAIKRLVKRAKAYAKKRNLTAAQVSKKLFGNVHRIDALERGTSFLLPDTYDEACRDLDRLEADPKVGQAA